jgi:Glycosyltransferase family 87
LIPADSHGLAIDSESSMGRAEMPLPRVLRWFWIGSVVAFVLMVLVNYLEYLAGVPWDSRSPMADPLFGDLLEFVPNFQLAHTTGFFRSTAFSEIAYPPLGAAFYALMYSFGHPVVFYLGIFALWLGIVIEGVRRHLLDCGINRTTAILFPLTLIAVSYPVEGLVQRGNIELFAWIFTTAGVWAFLRDRDKTAATLWGLAAATKLYPIILLALLVTKLRWKAFTLGLGAFLIGSIVSIAYMGPTMSEALKRSLRNVFGYQSVRASEWSGHEFAANHSAFVPVKFVALVTRGVTAPPTNFYYLAGGLIFVALFFGKVRKMPVINQVLVVTTFMVIMPPISYFYTLVHLYAPFLMLVFLAIRADSAGMRIPGLTGTILLFVPIFAAFTIFTYPKVFLFGGLIQAVMLISLLLRAAQFPFSTEGVARVDKQTGTEADGSLREKA